MIKRMFIKLLLIVGIFIPLTGFASTEKPIVKFVHTKENAIGYAFDNDQESSISVIMFRDKVYNNRNEWSILIAIVKEPLKISAGTVTLSTSSEKAAKALSDSLKDFYKSETTATLTKIEFKPSVNKECLHDLWSWMDSSNCNGDDKAVMDCITERFHNYQADPLASSFEKELVQYQYKLIRSSSPEKKIAIDSWKKIKKSPKELIDYFKMWASCEFILERSIP